MSISEQIYNIFNSEGKLVQLEHGLEALYSGYPIVSVLSESEIIFVSKKIPQLPLQAEPHNSIHKIADGLYINITGLPADIDYILDRCKTLAASTEYTLGCKLSPDVFATVLAEKLQIRIQKSTKRIPAFALNIAGFEGDRPILHYTDMSAVEYPCFAWCAGENHLKMLKYLEKNYKSNLNRDSALEIAIAALLESIGRDAEFSEIQVGIVKKDGIEYLSDEKIDEMIQTITETY